MIGTSTLDIRLKWILLVAFVGWVLYLLGPALVPFVIAACSPTCSIRWCRSSRGAASIEPRCQLVFLTLTLAVVAIVLVLIPFMERQVARFIDQLPRMTAWAREIAAPWIESHLGISWKPSTAKG